MILIDENFKILGYENRMWKPIGIVYVKTALFENQMSLKKTDFLIPLSIPINPQFQTIFPQICFKKIRVLIPKIIPQTHLELKPNGQTR